MGKANYPKGVRIVLDNGGKSADRYTAVYGEAFDYRDDRGVTWYAYRAMNSVPFHPQYGIGLFAQTEYPFWKRGARYRGECKRVAWDALPADVQRCITLDLQEATV